MSTRMNYAVYVLRYGIKLKVRSDPLLREGGKIEVRIPENDLAEAWRSILDIIIEERLVHCHLGELIAGCSWRLSQMSTNREQNCRSEPDSIAIEYLLDIYIAKVEPSEESLAVFMNELCLLLVDNLKALFSRTVYLNYGSGKCVNLIL
ncbi:unnamed protein product [Ambrosiozyma monospora]|uniref:Unnamed protein product n=1 Tax=Ambrosiozyma monospora TaxID=43982 RepID=A0A9W6SZT6_AMBMO|nr:unnamed protein product [Ambrosiozyma monospora]